MQTITRMILFVSLILIVFVIYKYQYMIKNLFQDKNKSASINDVKGYKGYKEQKEQKEQEQNSIANTNQIPLQLIHNKRDNKNDDIECISLGNVSKYSLSETTTDKSKLLESLFGGL